MHLNHRDVTLAAVFMADAAAPVARGREFRCRNVRGPEAEILPGGRYRPEKTRIARRYGGALEERVGNERYRSIDGALGLGS